MRYYVGMDIGGTSARIKAVGEDQRILGEYTGKGCTFNTCGYEVSSQIYREVVLTSLHEWNLLPEDCVGLCAAVSGVDSPELEEECRRIFLEMGFSGGILTICNDCEIVLKLTDKSSLVLVAGTGSIAYGKNSSGKTVRCGGWSHIVSDEGSGMDLGKQVLRAVGDHMDGRISCPILYQLFTEKSQIRTLAELDRYLTEGVMDKPKIAGFAALAGQAAEQGDEAAKRILEYAADALFRLVEDIYKKVKDEGGKPEILFLWGSVLTKNHMVADSLKGRVKQMDPDIEIQYPELEAIDIAVKAARVYK